MNYIFQAEKIKRLLSDFYIATGIAVTFYDSDTNMIATSPVYSDFCKRIRQRKECIDCCNRSDWIHMKQAEDQKKMVSYSCHAGLMETILPVFYEETLIGYMQIGQFRDADATYSSEQMVKRAAIQHGFDLKEMETFYRALPIVSAQKQDALQQILLILIKNFWEDGLIRHKRSMLSVKLEQYIAEHLKERLSVEVICEHFFLSKNALYRLFADEFGTTVGEYIAGKRIRLAEKLLWETELPITGVATECGFSDYNYFIRAFKKQVGKTPLQYRKKE